MGPTDPLLRIDRLTAGFDAGGQFLPAVRDVSLSLAPGETLGLVGESGSGKTVTALSVVRLLPAGGRITAGRILFDGRDLLALDEAAMRRVRGAGVGFVFQEPAAALSPVFTIGDQVAEAIVAHGQARWGEARRRAVDLLEAVRMPDPARRAREYPHELSGGQRQRAMIAVALACQPRLVIADEPTSALDVTIQAEILDLLADLRERYRLAVLLVTHDLGVVAQAADRVAVMQAGRVVEQGAVRDVLRSPRDPYTQRLLASVRGDGRAGPARAGETHDSKLGTRD